MNEYKDNSQSTFLSLSQLSSQLNQINKPIKHNVKYNNTESKRQSARREHLSNAALIGLANLYGADISVQIPISKNPQETITFPNIVVLESSLKNVSFENENEMKDVNEKYENENSEKEMKYEMKERMSRKQKELRQKRRNDRKTKIAEETNKLFQIIQSCDKNIEYEKTKKRPTTKTVKMNKFEWISPFNKDGFQVFASGVIDLIMTCEKKPISKKFAIVDLKGRNELICNLYYNILFSDCDYHSKQGLMYRQNMFLYLSQFEIQ